MDARKGLRAKKWLGQNFLVDGRVADRIVEALNPGENETILEIGPGEGALTGRLLDRGARVVAVEIDPDAADLLETRYSENFELVRGDILRFSIPELVERLELPSLRVLGNIPYNITSPILFRLIEQRQVITETIVMMQKEVAARLTADVRTKARGILSVATQTVAEPQRLFHVAPGSFRPVPAVTSSVLRLRFADQIDLGGIEKEHRKFVRAAFSKRRKTINNAVADLIPDARERERIFRDAGILANRRAEELSIAEFGDLARLFADATPGQRR